MAEAIETSHIDSGQRELKQKYGKYGFKSLQLSMKKCETKKQQYSVSFIAAIS